MGVLHNSPSKQTNFQFQSTTQEKAELENNIEEADCQRKAPLNKSSVIFGANDFNQSFMKT